MSNGYSEWKQFFKAGWRGLEPRIEHITESVRRHRWLIEAGASISQFEKIQNSRDDARRTFEAERRQQEDKCLMVVKQWLSPFGCETELDHHRNTRSICGNPGRWLFEHRLFQTWFSIEYCSTPLLWLSGIPGAGMAQVPQIGAINYILTEFQAKPSSHRLSSMLRGMFQGLLFYSSSASMAMTPGIPLSPWQDRFWRRSCPSTLISCPISMKKLP